MSQAIVQFQTEGDFPGEIIDTMLAEPKFADEEGAFDVALLFKADSGEQDWWRGEVSNEYGVGNFSDRTQAQITHETLTKLGFQGYDLTQIGTLVGVRTTAHVKGKEAKDRSGKMFYNISYLGGGGNVPQQIDEAKVKQSIAKFFPGAPAQPQQQAQQPQQQQATQPVQGQQPQQATQPQQAQAPQQGKNPFLS